MEKVILASSSPRRQALIQSLNIPYDILVSDVDESTDPDLFPEDIVKELAMRKAQAIYQTLRGKRNTGVIIGADTIVVFQGKILGKPKDSEEAFNTLKELQGQTHHVYSGIACLSLEEDKRKVSYKKTEVTMKPLSVEEIKAYIKTGEPMDKAGSYGIQGIGGTIVEKINGDYFNVVGMSLALLSDMLREFDIKILG